MGVAVTVAVAVAVGVDVAVDVAVVVDVAVAVEVGVAVCADAIVHAVMTMTNAASGGMTYRLSLPKVRTFAPLSSGLE